MKLRTWHLETLVVATTLIVRNIVTRKGGWVEWVGAAAVLVNFGHASIADRMAAKQAEMVKPDVECYRLANWYYLNKEFLWLLYFVLKGSYSALVGCVVFILYPVWRK